MVQIPWFRNTSVYVLADYGPEGTMQLVYILASLAKNKVRIVDFGLLNDLSKLSIVAASAPLHLCISGRGILMKETLSDELFGDEIISSFLPNANVSEFVYQVFQRRQEEGKKIAIVRKNSVDELLDAFTANGITVKQLFIGKTITGDIEQLADSTSGVREKMRTGYSENEDLKNHYETLIAIAANTVGSEWQFTRVNTAANQLHQSESGYFKRTRMLLIAAPVLILVILLANLFFYDYAESQYVHAKNLVEANRNELDSISELEDMLKRRTQVLGEKGESLSIPASYYADEIGSTVPGEITLRKLDIFPGVLDEETQAVITMQYDTIFIEGQSRSSEFLNAWIGAMNRMKWLSSLSILSYEQSSLSEPGNFELMLICK